MPRTLAFKVVQRQTAASRSASPLMRGQHCCVGGTPRLALRRVSKSTHTPSLSVSMGHVVPNAPGVATPSSTRFTARNSTNALDAIASC